MKSFDEMTYDELVAFKKRTKKAAIGCFIGAGIMNVKAIYDGNKAIKEAVKNNMIEGNTLQELSTNPSPSTNVNFYADKMSVGMTPSPTEILDTTDSLL